LATLEELLAEKERRAEVRRSRGEFTLPELKREKRKREIAKEGFFDFVFQGPDGGPGLFQDPVEFFQNGGPGLGESAKRVGGGLVTGASLGLLRPFEEEVGETAGFQAAEFLGEFAPLTKGFSLAKSAGAKLLTKFTKLAKLPGFVKALGRGAAVGGGIETIRQIGDVAHGEEFDTDAVLGNAALFGAGDAVFAGAGSLIKGAVKKIMPKDSRLFRQARGAFLQGTREVKARIATAHEKAGGWEKKFSESVREDLGALVENVPNLRTGKIPSRPLTKEMADALKDYKTSIEGMRNDVNSYISKFEKGEYIAFLDDYIQHLYVGNKKARDTAIGKWMTKSPNAKKRKIPTLAEAKKLGLTPLTQDIAFLYKNWAETNWTVAGNRGIIHALKKLKTPDSPLKNKKAIVAGDQPAVDWVKFDHPAIQRQYAQKGKDGAIRLWKQGVWVHPDIVPVAKMAFDNPYAGRGSIAKTFDTVNAFAKSLELVFSGFHAISLGESGQAVLARLKNPLSGLVLFGKEARAATGKPIALTFKAGKAIQKNVPGTTEDMFRHGLGGSARSDIGMNSVMKALRGAEAKSRNVPILGSLTRGARKTFGAMDKLLWDEIHMGYKAYGYNKILGEELALAGKDLAPGQISQIKQTITKYLNNASGGQEWESKFWLSPEGLKYGRRALLSLDWTMSNMNIFGDLFSKNQLTQKLAKRYWRNMTLSVFGSTQGLNYMATGHGTWDNEPGHKLDIDITPLKHQLQKLYGTYDPKDKQRYYVRIAKQAREIISWFQHPETILGNKASPLVRETIKQASQHGAGGGFPSDWTREDLDFWESIPLRIKSMAELFTPFSLSGNNFAFSLPMSKGMTPYKAIKAYQKALDAKQWELFGKRVTKTKAIAEIHKAAVDNGLNPKQLFTAAMGSVRGKYYDKFFEALDDGDTTKANEVAKILSELGATSKNIRQSAKRRGLITTRKRRRGNR